MLQNKTTEYFLENKTSIGNYLRNFYCLLKRESFRKNRDISTKWCGTINRILESKNTAYTKLK